MQKYRAYDTDIYVEEGSLANVRLLQSSGGLVKLSQLTSDEGKILSITNCSFFNPDEKYVLGRNQGDMRNDTHNDKEIYIDVAIKKDGAYKAGKMGSWEWASDVVCGFSAPALLIRDGQDVEERSDFYSRSILTSKHPRTAFAILKDKRCLQVVTDGRGVNSSIGMTGYEIRDFLKSKYSNIDVLAILDGGGSSELIVNGDIVNHLTDGDERPMLNGIAFIKRQPPTINKETKGATDMFIQRLSETGMKGNPFYYNQNENPYADNETGLPNCVTYAMGRSSELAGHTVRWELLDPQHKGLGHGMYPDAQLWYSRAYWAKGSAPKLGAILVWGGSKWGHVAIVEEILPNGRMIISQSNYKREIFQTIEIEAPVVGKITPKIDLKFLGYIYNPYVSDKRVKRDLQKDQVEILATQLKVRDEKNAWHEGRYALRGIYYILGKRKATINGTAYDMVKLANNIWIAVNDKAGWTKTYLLTQFEPPKEEPKSAENETVPEQPKNNLSEQLQKAVEELQKAISDLQSENRKIVEEKEKALAVAEEKKAALAKAEEEVKRYQDILEKMKELIA